MFLASAWFLVMFLGAFLAGHSAIFAYQRIATGTERIWKYLLSWVSGVTGLFLAGVGAAGFWSALNDLVPDLGNLL